MPSEHMHHASTNPYLDMVHNMVEGYGESNPYLSMIRHLREIISNLKPEVLEQLKSDVPDFDHYVWLLNLLTKETS